MLYMRIGYLHTCYYDGNVTFRQKTDITRNDRNLYTHYLGGCESGEIRSINGQMLTDAYMRFTYKTVGNVIVKDSRSAHDTVRKRHRTQTATSLLKPSNQLSPHQQDDCKTWTHI